MDRHVTIALEGEWDLSRERELHALLLDAATTVEVGQPLVVDLRGVIFIDSSALRAFVALQRRLGRSQVRLITLAEEASHITRLLRMLGLDEVLGLVETRPTD